MFITILYSLTLALALFCCAVTFKVYRLTRAPAVLVLLAAFCWASIVRAGVALDWTPIDENSRSLMFVTYVGYAAGMYLLYRALRNYYNGGGRAVRSIVGDRERVKAAALIVKLAAEEAAETLRIATETAAIVLATKERELEAQKLTEAVEKHIAEGK